MNRTVAVTGGSGKLGRAVVAASDRAGLEVVNFDRAPLARHPGAGSSGPISPTTARSWKPSPGSMRCTAASMRSSTSPPSPAPDSRPTSRRSTTICSRTYNVFQAAARLPRIRNLVWASSETLLGYPFESPPPYVPLDEEYPPRPRSSTPGQRPRGADGAPLLPLGPPAQDRSAFASPTSWTRPSTTTSPRSKTIRHRGSGTSGPTSTLAMAPKRSFGPSSTRPPGFESFAIANNDNVMSRSSADLMAEFFPDTEFRSPVEGTHRSSPPKRHTVCSVGPRSTRGATRHHTAGINRPKVSRVVASGQGPPRRPVSTATMAARSSALSSKSKPCPRTPPRRLIPARGRDGRRRCAE